MRSPTASYDARLSIGEYCAKNEEKKYGKIICNRQMNTYKKTQILLLVAVNEFDVITSLFTKVAPSMPIVLPLESFVC